MRMSSEKRTLWIIVRDGEETSDIKQFQFNPWSEEIVEEELQDKAHTKAMFLEALAEQLGIAAGKGNVLKLRNGRGSLIPLSRRTPENTVTSPYVLEVCRRHSSVKPTPRQVDVPSYNETYKRKLDQFSKRISKLENIAPKLSHLRDEKLSAEMKDLEGRLRFMNSKLKEADSRQWKGMFTKHPLW